MILRRLAEGVRNQDWFTVVVEVLIVVVGIFLGLQVDDWNQTRKDRTAEEHYLDRLSLEIRANLDAAIMQAENHESRGAIALEIRAFLTGEREAPPEEEEVRRALCRWHILPIRQVRTGTYDELESTGNLTLIRDEELRERLMEAFATHNTVRRQIDLFGNTIRDLAAPLRPFLEWYPVSDLSAPVGSAEQEAGYGFAKTSCRVDLEGMKGAEGLPSILAQLHRSQVIFANYRRSEANIGQLALDRMLQVMGR